MSHLPPEVHRRLDEEIPPFAQTLDLHALVNVLKVILTQCQEEYRASWPINVAAANQALLQSRPDIRRLLTQAQRTGHYAEIRELAEFHIDIGDFEVGVVEGEDMEDDAEHMEDDAEHGRRPSDERLIQDAFEDATQCINKYFEERPHMPLFQPPPYASDDIRKHINDLKLPITPNNARMPSLLIHNLRDHSSTHTPLDELFEVRDK
jgi:hypothetical protein